MLCLSFNIVEISLLFFAFFEHFGFKYPSDTFIFEVLCFYSILYSSL
jgi:hypothetical protein